MSKTTFVVLSFEGPDRYAHAGGLGSRVAELVQTLAAMGLETHLFFVGDPALPGHESLQGGKLNLHRWCQWISDYHPGGVYDGEEGKLRDWSQSLPPWLETEFLAPRIAAGESVVVLAEEWHTASSVVALAEVVARRGWTSRVRLLWNANNTYSFHRIDWVALGRAATITTVSRYMKHVMERGGVDARIVPNGISSSWFDPIDPGLQGMASRLLGDRLALVKVARWDPDKRWEMAIDATWRMKEAGLRPLLLARGGGGDHGVAVLDGARRRGLRVESAVWSSPEPQAMLHAIAPVVGADVVELQGFLSQAQRKVLYRAAGAVLANSGLEPFGLVGLEAMAVGGVAFVGCTGEEYATPGHDAVSIQSTDPGEVVYNVVRLARAPLLARELRVAARRTARHYTWDSVVGRILLPFLRELGVDVDLSSEATTHGEPSPEDGAREAVRPSVGVPPVRGSRARRVGVRTGRALVDETTRSGLAAHAAA